MIRRRYHLRFIGAALSVLLTACSPGTRGSPPPTAPAQLPSPSAQPLAGTAAAGLEPEATSQPPSRPASVEIPGAATIGLAVADDGALYAVFGQGQSLYVARSDDGGASFAEPVLASGSTRALVTPFERPTAIAGPGGAVAVSWLEQQDSRTTIWVARSDDRAASFAPPEQVAVSGEFETTMARLATAPPAVAVTWLQGGSLWLGRARGGEPAVAEVDGLVCECCQPAALSDGQRVILAYRDLERAGGVDTRDIAVTISHDGGASFDAPVRVSDTPWEINACPISGPALAAGQEQLYVAWMDGRADTAHDGSRGDLWVAASGDGGASYGPNVRVNRDAVGFHNLPALGVSPDGRLFVAWEANEGAGVSIQYTTSDDGGASFAPARTLAIESEQRGRPRNPALTVGPGGEIYVAWVDRAGGHVLTMAATAS